MRIYFLVLISNVIQINKMPPKNIKIAFESIWGYGDECVNGVWKRQTHEEK